VLVASSVFSSEKAWGSDPDSPSPTFFCLSTIAITIPRGKSDEVIDAIIAALRAYEADHQQAQIDLYRQNSVSVRVRIIDPDFASQGKSQRSQHVWRYFEQLPEEVHSDISTVLLLTPDETKKSFANLEFDEPIPSKL
jgi:hypothetical protein